MALNPNATNTHSNLGTVLLALGQAAEAAACFERAMALAPGRAAFPFNLGNALRAAGQPAPAEAAYRQAIALDPGHRDGHYNLANLLLDQGRPAAAEPHYRRALELAPGHIDSLSNLGVALHDLDRLEEAEARLVQAHTLAPDRADVLNNLGSVLKRRGRPAEAVAAIRQALALQPDLADAHANLADALAGQKDVEGALDHAEQAVRLRPDSADAHVTLANVLRTAGRFEAALDHYRQALALSPGMAVAHGNAGLLLTDLARPAEALAHYDQALASGDASADVRWNMSLTRLLMGDYAQGWREYEERWRTTQMGHARRAFSQPQWRGEAAAGRTLLLHAEQGLGDTLQFCRYAPLAVARGFRVVVEAHRPLVRLLRGLDGVAQVVAAGDPLPSFDLHCPLLSLPLAFQTTLDAVPANVPYLAPDTADVAAWAARMASACPDGPRLRVGLVWAGNPHSNAPDRRRSLDPRLLAPLTGVPGVSFFSLQKEGTAAPAGLGLIDLMPDATDFADTAALIANLDLVIGVDTAVVHLAGALGRPAWLLNRFDSCWRWLLHRADSPWYPTLRQFRQTTPGDWQAPIAQARAALATLRAG
ncbi:MAG: tetratricopeptide repeat protein [Azospirillaceae bacterium]|nr:tetratricopeptide repeat protein [Azospirillaceae bacterium]